MRPDATGLRARATALAALRTWFAQHGYLEVPTPTLVPSPAMEPTLHGLPVGGGFLRTSPEFALKRVLAEGLPRIYEIGPCFRDHEHGPWHRREFTMLEWYRAGATMYDLMDEVQDLVTTVARALGRPVPGPWERITVAALFERHTGLDLTRATAAEISPDDPDDWDGAFFRRWVTDVEPALTGPRIVTHYPASQAALARVARHRPWPVAWRFEVYLDDLELANAFLELRDPDEQRARFEDARAAQRAGGHAEHPVDPDFLEAVGRLPPAAGIALGVERLVAGLMGWPDLSPGRVPTPFEG